MTMFDKLIVACLASKLSYFMCEKLLTTNFLLAIVTIHVFVRVFERAKLIEIQATWAGARLLRVGELYFGRWWRWRWCLLFFNYNLNGSAYFATL
jgi:hypothetical protein